MGVVTTVYRCALARGVGRGGVPVLRVFFFVSEIKNPRKVMSLPGATLKTMTFRASTMLGALRQSRHLHAR
jgi:hypothetical protein